MIFDLKGTFKYISRYIWDISHVLIQDVSQEGKKSCVLHELGRKVDGSLRAQWCPQWVIGKGVHRLPRWLFPSKIYIWFTIFNTYFSAKLLFTNKRCHLHVLEKCLYVLEEVRSIIYVWQFIHPLSLRSRGNGTSFAFTSYIVSTTFCNVTFLNNSHFFHSFTICSSVGSKEKQNLWL